MRLAASQEFTALITVDKNMEYQQSSESLPLTVVVITPLLNRLSDLVPLVPSVLRVLREEGRQKFYRIDA